MNCGPDYSDLERTRDILRRRGNLDPVIYVFRRETEARDRVMAARRRFALISQDIGIAAVQPSVWLVVQGRQDDVVIVVVFFSFADAISAIRAVVDFMFRNVQPQHIVVFVESLVAAGRGATSIVGPSRRYGATS